MRHIESKLQQICVRWFRLQYPKLSGVFFAVPNGGYRNKIEGGILKAEGVLAGVSDLILLTPSSLYHGLCIEMKQGKGTQQESQKIFQSNIEANGYKYVICRNVEEFINEIRIYLGK
ncbi:MAG: VRR-NUC domain-containing protein [Rikenellaceae bacterium]